MCKIRMYNLEEMIWGRKICFIAPANSIHTKKWCKWFSQRGHEVYVISLTKEDDIDANVYFLDSGSKPTRSSPEKIAAELVRLYNDDSVRIKMGRAGRKFVEENYELNKCFLHVEEYFAHYIEKCR